MCVRQSKQSGLFLYDIFWVFGSQPVFGSNVMVSVAKYAPFAACWRACARRLSGLQRDSRGSLARCRGIQAPIKLLIPRLDGAGNVVYGILGLGDIVVPGALCEAAHARRRCLCRRIRTTPAS